MAGGRRSPPGARGASYELGQVQRAQGRLDAAVRTCQQALDAIARPGQAPLPAAGPAYVGLAEVAYQRNELDSALRHVTEGIALCRAVRLHRAAGRGPGHAGVDPAGHRRPGRRAGGDGRGRAGRARAAAGLLNPVPAQRARLLLAQGDLAGGRPLGGGVRPRRGRRAGLPREPGHLVLARVLLAQGRPGQALALLDRLHAAAAAQDRTGSVIEIRRAAGAGAGRQRRRSRPRWTRWPGRSCWPARRATSGSSPTRGRRWPRCWAGWSRPSGAGAAAAGVPLGCLARLQRAFDAGHAAPVPGRPAAAVPGIVEPLTGRELEVLGMLAAGRSNQAIAGAACRLPRHRQEARQPRAGQARRGQPHRGRRPGPASWA